MLQFSIKFCSKRSLNQGFSDVLAGVPLNEILKIQCITSNLHISIKYTVKLL